MGSENSRPERGRRPRGPGLGTGFLVSALFHGALAVLLVTREPADRGGMAPVDLTVLPKPEKTPEPKRELEPPRPPPPPEVAPKPEPVRKPQVARKPPPPPPVAPPPAPEVKLQPPSGGPRSFGIRLENTVLAAPGTGVPVPVGDTLATRPSATRPKEARPGPGSGEGEGAGPPVKTTALAAVQVMPKLRKDSVAEYPPEVRKLGIQGRVVLELVIDEDGKVARSRVVRGLHPRLDEAAMAASKGLGFAPGSLAGKPTAVRISYTYVFVLE